MSREAIDTFFETMAEDEGLQQSYTSAMDRATRAAAVEVAATRGLEFTAEELGAAMEEQMAELSDQQLDAVAGGLQACCCCTGRDGSFLPALYSVLQTPQQMEQQTSKLGRRFSR